MGSDAYRERDRVRLIHIIPAISEEASGPSYSVVRLCESLIEAGEDVTLAAMDVPPRPPSRDYLRLFPVGVGPLRIGRSPELYRWLQSEAASTRVDVLHSHGMWQMNAIYASWVSRQQQTRLVISPRGAFSRWAMAHGSPVKRVFWPLLQRPAVKSAACFHATGAAECEDIRRLGFSQPVARIPNGVDIPPPSPMPSGDRRTLLFLGRIHPTKGLDLLLSAWAKIMKTHPDWELRIVGTDQGYLGRGRYLQQVRALAASLRLERTSFHQPVYGSRKIDAYRSADLFVLPTRSESFGMTVAESLAAGTPVIVTNAARQG